MQLKRIRKFSKPCSSHVRFYPFMLPYLLCKLYVILKLFEFSKQFFSVFFVLLIPNGFSVRYCIKQIFTCFCIPVFNVLLGSLLKTPELVKKKKLKKGQFEAVESLMTC